MTPITLGPFLLDARVSGGANGDVWLAKHVDSGLPVAVKVLKAELALKKRAARGFRNEVRSMAALHHPHIGGIFDQGTIGMEEQLASQGKLAAGCPYLVMEWASGGTLADKPAPLDFLEFTQIIEPLLQALGHAHARGVIHRDLKPANVLFCNEQDLRPGLKLADFGLAVSVHPEKDVRRLLGTPHYMAPEQWRAEVRNQGPWTDLYALGCLVYRILTGHGPFRARTIKEMRKAHVRAPIPPIVAPIALPSGFQEWLDKLLAKRPEERFRNAAQALAAMPGHRSAPLNDPALLDEDTTPLIQSAGLGLYGVRAVPLVDREPQRAQLWAALSQTRSRGLQVLILEGPAGCGKSRLAEWLGVLARSTGVAGVLSAFHGPTTSETMGLGPMVARAVQALGLETEREALRARVAEWLLGQGSSEPFEVEALTSVLAQGRARTQGRVQIATLEQRLGVIERVIERLCLQGPQLLWIDDVQWAPQALALLQGLARSEQGRRLPLLVVATLRSGALAERADSKQALAALSELLGPRLSHIPVAPLSPEHGLTLSRRLLSLHPDLAQELADRSAGNPLFAIQLLAGWVDEQLLEPTERGYVLLPQGRDQLPDDLTQLWSQRLRALLSLRPPDDRRALEIAAVLGQRVEPLLWHSACERAWAMPSADLAEAMVAARLATTSERGAEQDWSFVHAMLRDTLLEQARSSGRLQAHARVCSEALRQLEGEPERIARLLELGGLAGLAATELQTALDQALDRGALAEARLLTPRLNAILKHQTVSAAGPSKRSLQATLSAARLGLLRGEPVEPELLRILKVAIAQGFTDIQLRALALLGQARLTRQDSPGARKALIQAARLVGDTRYSQRAHLEQTCGQLLQTEGKLPAALRRFQVAQRLLQEQGRPIAAARLILLQATCMREMGDNAKAEARARRALSLFEKLGALSDSAQAHAQLGDWDLGLHPTQAAAHYQAALARLEITGQGDRALRRRLMALALR